MKDGALEIWRHCETILKQYQGVITDALHASNQQNDPPAVMVLRTFDFGINTIGACTLLLQTEERNALFVCTLCRSFYETAVRVLWASRSHNGWQRLQGYWANEDRKWAEEATRIPSVAEPAAVVSRQSTEILERTDEIGKPYLPVPGMQQMLRDVVEHDRAEGIREESDHAAEFDYTNVYRFFCRAAHGHMVAIGRPERFLRHAKYGLVMATWSLLQAYCHVAGSNPREELDAIGQELLDLINSN